MREVDRDTLPASAAGEQVNGLLPGREAGECGSALGVNGSSVRCEVGDRRSARGRGSPPAERCNIRIRRCTLRVHRRRVHQPAGAVTTTGLRHGAWPGIDGDDPGIKTLAPIHANTPQAKGPANQTDRVVRDMETPAPPALSRDYRNLLHDSAALNLILSLHTPRKLSRNLTCRYRSREYQIQGRPRLPPPLHRHLDASGRLDSLAQGQPPSPQTTLCRTVARPAPSSDRYKPSPDHPWNRWAASTQASRLADPPWASASWPSSSHRCPSRRRAACHPEK